METITMPQLWTVAGVLAGFQIAALTWRINRELSMEKDEERTWVTIPDAFVAASFALVAVAFATSLSDSWSIDAVAKLLATSAITFAASPFLLAGHYNLYCSWGKEEAEEEGRNRVTNQEWATSVILTPLITSGVWWIWA